MPKAAGSVATPGPGPAEQATADLSAFPRSALYTKLGVRTFINAYGTLTTLSGSLMYPEVKAAMEEASRHFVKIHELQAQVGKRLAELTGAEAAFVTSGSSAALCLATCAVTAGGDPAKIDRLPDLTGMKSEIVIQKAHRNPYDHAFRMVGVKLVEAETAKQVKAAIGKKTAALAMVLTHSARDHRVSLEEMIAIAHAAGLPLILDAAAELPPASNLRTFVKMGADLVAFSGGKNMRGPQCSGMLLGRKKLIEAAYVNSAPHDRFARIAKVGKEQIIGVLAAVELFLSRDEEQQRREWTAMLDRIAARLAGIPTVVTEYITNDDYSHSPRLSVQWNESRRGVTLDHMMSQLEQGDPPIIAADMTKYVPHWKRGIGIFAHNLRPGEELIVAERVREILAGRSLLAGDSQRTPTD
ncbi:MAG: aminotransferase class V-fold PLP-dependent enzyme [Verrucomicrobia bacterium]|nr:aminotransferase class V-fold PLP-dependent enzyme [Verrucomicrobiota bacterium]